MKLTKMFLLIILSIFVTIIVAIADAILRNQLVAGVAGFPFRFSEVALFGGGETNYLFFILDIIFWFSILLLLFKYLPKLLFRLKK